MPVVSIRDQLKKLVELQVLDTEIYQFKKELREKPLYIDELKKKYEDKKANLKSLEDKSRGILVDRKSKEVELQAKEGDIVKANSQLSQLKTNKEYHAKMSEIENIKADKSIIEEKILLLFDEGDGVNALIEKEKAFLAEEEKRYLSQKKEVDDLVKEIEDKVKVLTSKREQITPDIDKVNLSRYEKILKNKEGMALVAVKDNACGGCFMSLPPQVINEIKMHDRIIFCEMCARMLYLEDDL